MKKLILLITLSICVIFFPSITQAQIINTVVGTGSLGFSGDGGQAINAQLNLPEAVAFDAAGNMYIADLHNNRIRKVTTSGVISTFAGTGTSGYSGDGGQAISAQLNGPCGLSIDASGNMYIADEANHRVRKINTSGVISTFAGTGTPGFSGDGSAATSAQFNSPSCIAFDASGNVYIADYSNQRIRKVNSSGIVSTYAGTGSLAFNGDNIAATTANLDGPYGITTDAAGNLYIATFNNSRIRKVNSSGIISTFAGTGVSGFSGDGGNATSAQLNGSSSVAIDAAGNFYISDYFNHRVRKINSSGIISTYAGTGLLGYSGDGSAATSADLDSPVNVKTDAAGNLYITEEQNHVIRKVSLTTGISSSSITSALGYKIYPNPVSSVLQIQSSDLQENTATLLDIAGKEIIRFSFQNSATLNVEQLPEAIYFLTIESGANKITRKINIKH